MIMWAILTAIELYKDINNIFINGKKLNIYYNVKVATVKKEGFIDG